MTDSDGSTARRQPANACAPPHHFFPRCQVRLLIRESKIYRSEGVFDALVSGRNQQLPRLVFPEDSRNSLPCFSQILPRLLPARLMSRGVSASDSLDASIPVEPFWSQRTVFPFMVMNTGCFAKVGLYIQ